MSFKPLALATFLTLVLLGMVSDFPKDVYLIAQGQHLMQSTSINLNHNDLSQPLVLTIKALNGANIKGEIYLNGQVIKTLQGNTTEVNLSNYLSRGNYGILITGMYYPSQSSVSITLDGNGTQVSQQTGKTGLLKQQINLEVQ
ncbi:MAG: hypothetical protein QNJ64_15415 [Crocosphaera sp.]|nr:hypothetical protein [Crocosphaera sp.]